MINKPAKPGLHLRRRLPIVLGFALAGALLWLSLQPTVLSVETARVARGALVVTVDEQGRTRAREPYTITAPVYGQLLRTDKIEGDRVQAGEVLAQIAVAPENQRTQAVLEAAVLAAQARQSAAQASVVEAAALLARARQEAARREDLLARRMIGQEERDAFLQAQQAAAAREQAMNANLLAAQSEVASAKSQLLGVNAMDPAGLQNIVAPVAGTVQQVFEKSERIVAAGTALFQLSDGDTLELMIDLLTQDAVRVSAGDAILISGWGGAQVLQGRVSYVEPQAFTKYSALGVEEQRVNVIGELRDPNPGLGAQYRIQAAIVVDEFTDALTVPNSALFRRDERWQVFVVEQGRVRQKALEIGARGVAAAQVLQGLDEGEQVILFPSDRVVAGLAVKALD